MNRPTGNDGFCGVNGNGQRYRGMDRFQHRHEASEFFGIPDRLGARPRRFGANVYDVGAFVMHLLRMAKRLFDRNVATAIRK